MKYWIKRLISEIRYLRRELANQAAIHDEVCKDAATEIERLQAELAHADFRNEELRAEIARLSDPKSFTVSLKEWNKTMGAIDSLSYDRDVFMNAWYDEATIRARLSRRIMDRSAN